jgi:hypothetical protein
MTSILKLMCFSAAIVIAAPAFAQADPHAGHHPATASADVVPPIRAAAKPGCKMMDKMAMDSEPAAGTTPPGTSKPEDKMAGGMGDMMKSCMRDHAAAPADHKHGD